MIKIPYSPPYDPSHLLTIKTKGYKPTFHLMSCSAILVPHFDPFYVTFRNWLIFGIGVLPSNRVFSKSTLLQFDHCQFLTLFRTAGGLHRVFIFIVGIQFWHICFTTPSLFLSLSLVQSPSFSHPLTPPSISLSHTLLISLSPSFHPFE